MVYNRPPGTIKVILPIEEIRVEHVERGGDKAAGRDPAVLADDNPVRIYQENLAV